MNNTTTTPPADSKTRVITYLQQLHDHLTIELGQLDSAADFVEDAWQRDELGYGRSRVLQGGALFEQAGINFSEIQGDRVPATLLGQHPQLKGQSYWGAGVSMVLHPMSPFVPTVHLNFRYFEAGSVWWFGGGMDLTPYYLFEEDALHWHQQIHAAMAKHHADYYPAFKYWCDEYFYNHHRSETRGIGGCFYDYQNADVGFLVKADYARASAKSDHPALQLQSPQRDWQTVFDWQADVSAALLPAYLPIVARRRDMTWSPAQREFQLYRRGRYVEFNLLHDRGTLFGIRSNGRTESILMSLPPLVRWQYNYQPPAGSAEEKLTKDYLHRHINWLGTQT